MAVHSRDGRGMRLAFIISLISARLAVASPAEAAKRFALVIGNNAYENVPQLQKAVNDADAIAAELSKLGFDVVKAENVGRHAIIAGPWSSSKARSRPATRRSSISRATASPSTARIIFSPSMCLLPTLARKGLSRMPPLLQTGFPSAGNRFSGNLPFLSVPRFP